MSGDAGPVEEARALPVAALLADPRTAAQLTLVAGHAGLARPLSHARVQKNGLAFAGHFHVVVPSRIQVVGETEQTLATLIATRDARTEPDAALLARVISSVVFLTMASARARAPCMAPRNGTCTTWTRSRSSSRAMVRCAVEFMPEEP